jgi:DNA-binding NtrC family response regulator
LAATNADVQRLAAEGRLRRDLLDRFGYFVLRVPSLADRRAQIIPLAQRFVDEARVEYGPSHSLTITPEVQDYLRAQPWPGNVRQLRLLCRFAAAAAQHEPAVELRHLPEESVWSGGLQGPSTEDRAHSLQQVLLASRGNKSEAARRSGCSRTTVYRRLKRMNATAEVREGDV